MTQRQQIFRIASAAVLLTLALTGCEAGPSATGAFDRTLTVTSPLRLELANTSGEISITGSTDGQVHIHADIRASGRGFEKPEKRIQELVANPPIELRGDTLRIGKETNRMRNASINYTISVPHDTEVTIAALSGSQTIREIRGPLKAESASGSIRAERIERQTQLTTLSGGIDARDIGDDLRASTSSGAIVVTGVKGDARLHNSSGSIRVSRVSGRIEGNSVSGLLEVQDASKDVKAQTMSGTLTIQGNPASASDWDLKTVSGGVTIRVAGATDFKFSADATSGEIRTDIPIVIEEQSKHSLRAHAGSGGGRIEVHTVSGNVRVGSS
jgi:DUF4097 and DUF4098 domain-containing protein YvlB